MKGGQPEAQPAPSVADTTKQEPATILSTPEVTGSRRWQVEVEEAETVVDSLSLEGTVIITDDGWGIAEALCSRLESRGLSTIRVGFEAGIRDVSIQTEQGRTVHRGDPGNNEHLESITSALSDVQLAGVIHLAPMKLASAEWAEDVTPSSQVTLSAHGWFGLLKGLDATLASLSNGLIASVTAMDGRHGTLGERFNSIQCAASGVTKSYSFERPQLRSRALDVHPELIFDAENAAELIEHELFNYGGDVEIGLDRDERRWILAAFAEDVVGDVEPLQSDDVWLVSGGGSGVTAACIIGVAKASEQSGATFHLLGRSVLIEQTSEWLDWSEEQLTMSKRRPCVNDLMAASESGKVTMVEWNTAWQKYSRSRDVYNTIRTIEATGNDAFVSL